MKISIYELLGMIKDNNIPQRIIFKGQIYEYVESAEDYYNEEHGYIFDAYVLKSILNDEVEIIEDMTIENIDSTVFERAGTNYKDNMLKDKINEIIDYINKEE